MRWIILLAALPLAGCLTDDANIYGSLNGQRVVGNETYVTISNVWNDMDALPLADKHCGQFGRAAHFSHREGYEAIFDCVRR